MPFVDASDTTGEHQNSNENRIAERSSSSSGSGGERISGSSSSTSDELSAERSSSRDTSQKFTRNVGLNGGICMHHQVELILPFETEAHKK